MLKDSNPPSIYTLPAKQKIPIDNSDDMIYNDPKKQIYKLSLLTNQSTYATKKEIDRLFKLRDEYKLNLQEAEAKYEIDVFESKLAGKPAPQMPTIPLPSGLNVDILRANEPSSAVRMYTSNKKVRQSNPTTRIQIIDEYRPATTIKKTHMIHHCAYCKPEPQISLPTKPRNGPTHWQVLDEPLLPSLPPNSFVESRKTRPFYAASKKSVNLTIPIITDDLVERVELNQTKFEREMKMKKDKEDKQRTKLLHTRALANRDKMRKRQSDLSDLESRSGQLRIQTRLTMRNSCLAHKKALESQNTKITQEDIEAMAELKKFDDALYNQDKLQKKNDPISLMLMQDQSSSSFQVNSS